VQRAAFFTLPEILVLWAILDNFPEFSNYPITSFEDET
jgi:hypothetical protein